MTSPQRLVLPLGGIVLIILLRMAIGWQFLYEGLWKIDSLSGPTPWTSEGYLRNAQGPFRRMFRDMTGDPNDFQWLDAETTAARWDTWHQAFVAHYGLDDAQQRRLSEMINGVSEFRVDLAALPEGLTADAINKAVKSVKYDAASKKLICDGKLRLIPAEKERLLKLVSSESPAVAAWQKAVEQLAVRTARLSYKEKLRASLLGDPERAGVVQEQYEGTIDFKRIGDIELYREQVKRYEANLGAAKQDFNFDHLSRQWQELQELRVKVVGPVKALEKEMKDEAAKLLATTQLARGPVKLPWTRVDWINAQTIAGLTILGATLIVGLFTRVSAVLGAAMLVMFYLPMPPWPGVPEAPGPEHSFIINKNLIEALALLAIAALPTGQWFGVDAWLGRVCCRKKTACCGGTCHSQPAAPAAVQA